MAEAVVSIALEKLTEVVAEQLQLFAGATNELENLSYTFRSIQAVLDDADSRQLGEKHVQLWLSSLRHAAYDVEDLLEDSRLSGLGDQEGNEDDGNRRNKECECFPLPHNPLSHAVYRYNVARRIKEIRERLDRIDDERNRFNFYSSPLGGDHSMFVRTRRLTTFMDKSELVIGRENDKETIISRLISGSSNNDGQVYVVAIVGIGGLGKTTLAQQICHDSRVQDHFNITSYWVCVSDVFDVISLTKAILEQVKGTNNFPSQLYTLQKQLQEALRGMRFFLVLDDVWNDDADKWNMLQIPLTSGAQGSRILVTTRSKKVANAMNAAYIHELKGLSDDDSWGLFRSRAFAGWQSEECLELENVGREIVKKCRGVPLLIMVIGSTMNSKKTVVDWKNILNIKTWSLLQVNDNILPDLLLTYWNLPSHLKQCFAYCSLFPKDWEFKKDKLVQIWVAQGFIRPQGNEEIEDIGGEYFDELVARSILQQVEKDGETRYTFHGFLQDLAEFIAGEEIYTFISEGGKSEQPLSSNVRHVFLSFADNDDRPSNIPIAARGAKKLRTLWLHGIDRSDGVIVDLLHQARFLRALFFTGSVDCGSIVKSADIIGNLKHLRFLDLSCSSIEELPESVSSLWNLHTLNLTGCVKLKRLPGGMGKMFNLRHLEIERTDSLECLPTGLGRISRLRSLCKFIVGGGGCQIDELRELNSLQGILRIQYLERVSSRGDAETAQLWNKPHIRRLVLSMFGRDDIADIQRMDSVLEGLRPHANFEELKLFCYTGSKLPIWMQMMRRLRKLELYGCSNLEGVSPHSKLPSPVRELMIRDCHRFTSLAGSSFEHLEKISVIDSSEFFATGFPHLSNLRTFEIHRFRNETLPDDGWDRLVALETLEIWNCDELKCLPDSLGLLESLEHLNIRGLEKLESVPNSLVELKALNHLEICLCGALGSLPHGLQRLSLLRQLYISDCPLLSERCLKEEGEDRPNIQ